MNSKIRRTRFFESKRELTPGNIIRKVWLPYLMGMSLSTNDELTEEFFYWYGFTPARDITDCKEYIEAVLRSPKVPNDEVLNILDEYFEYVLGDIADIYVKGLGKKLFMEYMDVDEEEWEEVYAKYLPAEEESIKKYKEWKEHPANFELRGGRTGNSKEDLVNDFLRFKSEKYRPLGNVPGVHLYEGGETMYLLKKASNKDEILNIESILKDNFSKVKKYETYFFTPNEDKKLQKFLNPPNSRYINDWRYGYFFEAASILFNKYGMDYKQVENAINNI